MDAHELHTGPRLATPKQAIHADAAQRAQKAWAARVAGGTWAQVAELVGFADASTACRAVRTYFGQLPVHDHEESRELWRARNEVLWRQSMTDMKAQKPGAVRAAVAVSQRAAALDGLDRPTKHSITADDEVQQLVDYIVELQRLAGVAVIEGDPFADEIEGVIVED